MSSTTRKNFINSNQAGLDLLGYSREELLSMRIPDVDADPAAVLPAHEELLSGGRLINYEHSLRRKDGTVVSVLNNSRPLTDSQGNVTGMLSTLIDITERKRAEAERERLEEQLQRSRKLEAVGQLAGGIAHDFNNLLQAILGFTELLQCNWETDSEDGQSLEEIRLAAERAAELTQQLLAFSRRQIIQPVNLDLNELVQGILTMIRAPYRRTHRAVLYAGGAAGHGTCGQGAARAGSDKTCASTRATPCPAAER